MECEIIWYKKTAQSSIESVLHCAARHFTDDKNETISKSASLPSSQAFHVDYIKQTLVLREDQSVRTDFLLGNLERGPTPKGLLALAAESYVWNVRIREPLCSLCTSFGIKLSVFCIHFRAIVDPMSDWIFCLKGTTFPVQGFWYHAPHVGWDINIAIKYPTSNYCILRRRKFKWDDSNAKNNRWEFAAVWISPKLINRQAWTERPIPFIYWGLIKMNHLRSLQLNVSQTSKNLFFILLTRQESFIHSFGDRNVRVRLTNVVKGGSSAHVSTWVLSYSCT